MNCVRLFIVEKVSVFQDIDIVWVFACNWIGKESIPSAGVCSRVVARLRIFCFSICHWCHLGNVTSRHCDYQRKIGPFVRMMYNFQLICGNNVWFSAQLWGKSTHFWVFVRNLRPVCGIGPFVGIGSIYGTDPVCESYIYIISIHFNFKPQSYFTISVWAICKYWKEVNLSLQFTVGLFVLIKLVLVYGFGFKPVSGFTTYAKCDISVKTANIGIRISLVLVQFRYALSCLLKASTSGNPSTSELFIGDMSERQWFTRRWQ